MLALWSYPALVDTFERWNPTRRCDHGRKREKVRARVQGADGGFGAGGLLAGATTNAGKVRQAAVRVRLKEVRDDPDGGDERDALEVCLELMKSLAAAERRTKAAQTEMDSKVLNQYATLTVEEIAAIVVEDKWMASVEAKIGQQVKRLAGGLVDRVSVLTERYADALPELERRVEDYGGKVTEHLRRMGVGE